VFLAFKHVSSVTNLRQCEDQSWLTVKRFRKMFSRTQHCSTEMVCRRMSLFGLLFVANLCTPTAAQIVEDRMVGTSESNELGAARREVICLWGGGGD
jgi:hypothetical protein